MRDQKNLILLTLGKLLHISLKERANWKPFKRRSLSLFLFLDLVDGKTWRRVIKSPYRRKLCKVHWRAVLATSTSSTITTIFLASIKIFAPRINNKISSSSVVSHLWLSLRGGNFGNFYDEFNEGWYFFVFCLSQN